MSGGGGGVILQNERGRGGGQISFYLYKNKSLCVWGGGGGEAGFSHAEVLRDFINTEHLSFSHAEGGGVKGFPLL